MARFQTFTPARALSFLKNPESKFYRVFRYRDFRLLWIGAFLSFVGSWVQNVGQGVLVYDLTGSKERLALISLCSMIPVTILGPFAGSYVDKMNKRALLAWSQVLLAMTALLVAYLTWTKTVRVEHLFVIAFLNGIVSCFEMPARQATVSSVVPKEDLAIAIPFQGLTFNLARVFGPALAALLLVRFGVDSCYLINGISFIALIFAALAIKADLSAKADRTSAMFDLIVEGFRYTWREKRLRMLFLLETGLSFLALFYLVQMPAIAKDMLHMGDEGVGIVTTGVGIGAILALIIVAKTADDDIKGLLIRGSVTLVTIGLLLLSFATTIWVAMPVLILLGLSNVTIFNTCNSLFQQIAPEHLRGRVISMHIWALSGIGPIGVYPFGWIAEHKGLPFALQLSAGLMVLLTIWAWTSKLSLEAK
ncbi:MAG: MFS transporter [Armatimonadetes bacterium]|nr:MFS transporter [Armatimonadota bacterium]